MRKIILVLALFLVFGCSTNTVNKSNLITSIDKNQVLLSFYRTKDLDLVGTRDVIKVDGKVIAKLQIDNASQTIVNPGKHILEVYNEANLGGFAKTVTLDFEAGKKYYFTVGKSKDGTGTSWMGHSFSRIPENVWLSYLSE